jgi:DNA polymerase-3 subunit gamma/tau
VLGIEPRHSFFALDRAVEAADLNAAFRLSQELFYQGKDLHFFLEGLIEHFRTVLLFCLGAEALKAVGWLSDSDRANYLQATRIYSREQCLAILDYLVEAQEQLKQSISKQLTLEMILLRVIRMRQRVPIDILVKKLADFEQRLNVNPPVTPPTVLPTNKTAPPPPVAPAPIQPQRPFAPPAQPITAPASSPAKEPATSKAPESKMEALKKQSRYDTLLRFAAIELDGTVKN